MARPEYLVLFQCWRVGAKRRGCHIAAKSEPLIVQPLISLYTSGLWQLIPTRPDSGQLILVQPLIN